MMTSCNLLLGNVRATLLVSSVPLFATIKAEKAFGFRVNQVYYSQSVQENKLFFSLPII